VGNYDFKIEGEKTIKFLPSSLVKTSEPNSKFDTYYIVVLPDFHFFDIFRDNYYTFSVSWRHEETVPHLNSQALQTVSTPSLGYSRLRHYVQDTSEDIRVSLLSRSGHQELYVTVGGQKVPTNETYDFTTRFMKGGNYKQGKALLLPTALLANTNPACRDLGYAEEEACVLQLAVHCAETAANCSGQVEIDYESKTPRRVYSGQTKHALLQPDSKNYYFMSVSAPAEDIFAVMSTVSGSGDADLFVTVQVLSKASASQGLNSGMATGYLSWWLPSPENNTYAAKTKLGTEMIHIRKEDLDKHCLWNASSSTDSECMVVFAVLPTESADN
jgi:hypothetical protein